MPRAGQGGDLALRHALAIDSYDMYCGHACSLVAVDVQATSLAFEALFASKALRQKMGAAGRERARQYFDWSAIIPRYEALWKQQEEIRLAQELGQSRLQHPWPARLDPFYAFDTYPSVQLGADTQIKLVDINADKAWQRLMQYKELRMVRFANAIVFNDSECRAVLQHLENGPASVQDLLQHVPFQRRRMVSRSLVWLAKLHIVAWQ